MDHHPSAMRKTAEITLRPRSSSDDAFILRLSRRVFAPYSIEPLLSMTAMLAEPDALVEIAETAGEPVGFHVLGFERLGRAFGPWQDPALARLNAIGVAPALHGRGVGSALLEHAERAAVERGAVSMTLMTADTNTRAQRLFQGRGYELLYAVDEAYTRGQRGLVMTKLLALPSR
jgi:ribosomal protein S18 acetylase RimI-like enzyme